MFYPVVNTPYGVMAMKVDTAKEIGLVPLFHTEEQARGFVEARWAVLPPPDGIELIIMDDKLLPVKDFLDAAGYTDEQQKDMLP